MSEPETKPQAASEQTTATPETTLAAEVASLSKTINRVHASLILMADVVNKQGIFLQAMPGQLKRLDQIDKRLFHIEDLSTPRFEGDLSIVGAYQAMVHEIADIKNAVIDLQKRQKHLEGDTSPDRPVVIDPRYKSPPKH